ncbi:MAG: 1-acyl-sn-glycerol-3-phosphate acyltransferase [Clostridia bacterium]|nr:1-acyl-sn-glycerol-3-phosphate acyltransferase [Clostridia bacterium]
MKNIFYKKALSETVDILRPKSIIKKRKIHFLIKPVIKIANKKIIVIENYPQLPNGEAFIFAAGHSFPDEIAANLAVIDRHTYVLVGTKDQVINNPAMAILWLNGMVYVEKLDKQSRRDSFQRMKKVLQNGSSVMLFPEGVLNNTENKLCNDVYPGFYHLAIETGKKVVPIVSQTYNDSKIIRFNSGEPTDISCFTKEEARLWLKDTIASLRYNLIIKEPSTNRESLVGDIHLKYMEERKNTYSEVHWTEDVFDVELQGYYDENNPTPQSVRASFDKVKITPENAKIFSEILVRREEDKKYDFKTYMHENWNKSAD